MIHEQCIHSATSADADSTGGDSVGRRSVGRNGHPYGFISIPPTIAKITERVHHEQLFFTLYRVTSFLSVSMTLDLIIRRITALLTVKNTMFNEMDRSDVNIVCLLGF